MVFPTAQSTEVEDIVATLSVLQGEIKQLRAQMAGILGPNNRFRLNEEWIKAGKAGQVLQTTAGETKWVNPASLSLPGSIGSTVGSSGQILQSTGGVATWVGMSSGTLFYGNSSGEVTELAKPGSPSVLFFDTTQVRPLWSLGSSGTMLFMDGGKPNWVGLDMGELWTGDSSGFMTVLGAGSSGQVLQTTGSALAWRNSTTIPGTIGSTVGTSGQVLETTGGVAAWRTPSGGGTVPWSLTAFFSGGNSTIVEGVRGTFRIPWSVGWDGFEMVSNIAGDIGIGIYIDDLSSTPTSSNNSISSADFTLSGAQRTSGAAGSSATTTWTEGDYLTFEVTAGSSSLTWAALSLWGTRSL